MRVQLRDCNPPNRGAWKYGRGRGRYQHYGSSRHHADPSVTLNETLALLGGGKGAPFDKRHSAEIMTQYIAASSPEKRVDVEPSSSGKVDVLHSSVVPERFESDTISAGDIQLNENETNDDFASNPPPMGSRLSSPAHSSSKDVSSGYEHYREWYQQDASSHTPPSSSLGSSASATAPVPYSIPNAGYYSPAWMQPYAPQLQYQMPFIPGYTGFGMQATQVPPTYTSSGGSDASGPASGAANPWAAMGSMFTVSFKLCSTAMITYHCFRSSHSCRTLHTTSEHRAWTRVRSNKPSSLTLRRRSSLLGSYKEIKERLYRSINLRLWIIICLVPRRHLRLSRKRSRHRFRQRGPSNLWLPRILSKFPSHTVACLF